MPLLAMLALMRWLDEGALRFLWMTGAASGAALLWWQDAGAYIVVTVATVLAWSALASRAPMQTAIEVSKSWLGGFALIVTPVLAWLGATAAIGPFLYYVYLFPVTVYTRKDGLAYVRSVVHDVSRSSAPLAVYRAVFFLVIFAVPFLVVVGGVLLVVRTAKLNQWQPPPLAVVTIFGGLCLRTLVANMDEAKLFDLSAPYHILLTVCVAGAARGLSRMRWVSGRLFLRAALVATVLAFPVHRTARTLHERHASRYSSVVGYRVRGASPPTLSPDELEHLIAAVQSASPRGRPILVLPFQPFLYELSDRSNPTSYDYLDPTYVTASTERRMISQAERARPALVVLAATRFADSGPTGEEIAPRVYSWVRKNYRLQTSIGEFDLLVPAERRR
jgi:hypothetical protein